MKPVKNGILATLVLVTFLFVSILGFAGERETWRILANDEVLGIELEELLLKPLPVAPGTLLKLELPSNPTTGYYWYYEGLLDMRYVKMVSEEFIAPTTGLVGAGGKQIFVFETQWTLGLTTLNFAYYRNWEGIQPDTDILTIHLLIQ
ncbi:MAG TPA: protease inhibitor I42 family protein [Thermotogota bacterium]|nr:protease inhibitor I42 family protein [Thermotogaceae bacterium]HNW45771.1 protease inhibitor I42 family protein [Thermotogota bacterium]HOD90516.1 protease inhibitor I42 family protein [Thermotogota bacterium]HOH12771.1 protease inhibitor I42 family protein [Thermotogota bacterium]HPG98403.1 protease inhibitor I42 family protein [Thermotogota bacterium]